MARNDDHVESSKQRRDSTNVAGKTQEDLANRLDRLLAASREQELMAETNEDRISQVQGTLKERDAKLKSTQDHYQQLEARVWDHSAQFTSLPDFTYTAEVRLFTNLKTTNANLKQRLTETSEHVKSMQQNLADAQSSATCSRAEAGAEMKKLLDRLDIQSQEIEEAWHRAIVREHEALQIKPSTAKEAATPNVEVGDLRKGRNGLEEALKASKSRISSQDERLQSVERATALKEKELGAELIAVWKDFDGIKKSSASVGSERCDGFQNKFNETRGNLQTMTSEMKRLQHQEEDLRQEVEATKIKDVTELTKMEAQALSGEALKKNLLDRVGRLEDKLGATETSSSGRGISPHARNRWRLSNKVSAVARWSCPANVRPRHNGSHWPRIVTQLASSSN